MRSGALSEAYGIRLLFQPRIQRLAVIALLLVVLAIRVVQFFGFTGVIQWGYDLSAYWAAALRLLDGQSIYQPFQLAGPYSPQQQFLYLYPPFLAVVVSPLAAVIGDYRVANWVWAAFGATILVVTVVSIARRERIARGSNLALLVGAAFAYAPVVSELNIGNVHLLILGLLAGAWLGVSRGTRGGDITAGVLVGMAALIKVFPGLIVVWFLVTGRVRAAVAAVAAMALLVVATLPVVGLDPWLEYPRVLANLGRPVELTDVLAPTVWLSALMSPLVAQALVTIVGIAIVVWVARRSVDAVSFATTVVVSLLIAPALYPHYLAIMILPLLLAVRLHLPWLLMLVVFVSAFGGGQEVFGEAAWVFNRAVPVIGALLLVGGLVWYGPRGHGRPSEAAGV
jgi:alpha-1,2-mannosyltransferase